MNGMMKRQFSLEHTIKGLNVDWQVSYSDHPSGPGSYGFHLQLYVKAMSERNANIYEDMITSLKTTMTAIANLDKGYLLSKLCTPITCKMITDSILHLLQKANPAYVLALCHITQYYCIKLITLRVDNNHSLVVYFPVFIKIFNINMVLFNLLSMPGILAH